MKRGIIVLLIAIALGALAGGWWWARTSPEQATRFLEDGGLESGRAEEFVALVGGVREVEEEGLLASGTIEGEEVAIVSEFGGRIVRLSAEEGDEVEAGEELVELDRSGVEAQVRQAEAAEAAAEANLAQVRAGRHPGEIVAAEAAVVQSLTQRNAARRVWQDGQSLLDNPQELEAQIVEMEAAVGLAEAEIEQAAARIAQVEAERDRYQGQGSMEEKQLYRLYDYQVAAAEVGQEAVGAKKAAAEETLAALKALRDNPLALVSQVHLMEGQYRVLEAGVGVAVAKLREVKAGPTPEEVKVAEAQVRQAEAAVSSLEAQKEKLTVRTPISGVVTSRSAHAGEAAVAGARLLTVANLDEVKLTIYIPEDELGRVYLGQEVGVEVDSFLGKVFSGTVSYISQQAEFTPKNVQTEKERVNMVFAVKVRLPNPGHLLKPGMPADALLGEDRRE